MGYLHHAALCPMMRDLSESSVIFLKVNYTLLLSSDIELNPGPYAQPSECAQARLIKVICIARFEITTGTHQCICVC